MRLNMNQSIRWPTVSVLIASIVLLPLLAIIWLSFGNHNDAWSHLVGTVLADYIVTSLLLMLGVSCITLVLGVGSAFIVTHFDFTGKGFFDWALLLPLAVPTYIIAYSYTGLLDVAGPIQTAFRNNTNLNIGEYAFPEIRSLGGAIFVMGFVLYPYVYLLARAAFLEQSVNFKDVARLLGLSQSQAFFKITLPIARPAIVAGVSLALMETLADFGAVSYFGLSTFTTGIFRTWYGLDSVAGASQLALMLLGFIIILISMEKLSRKKANYQSEKTQQGLIAQQLNGKANFLATALVFLPLLLGFIVPILQLCIWAIKTYATLFTFDFWHLLLNTLSLAALTACLALLLSLLIAYANRIKPNTLTSASKQTIGLGYAIPGTVIALGTLIPLAKLDNTIDAWFRATFDISTGLIISGSLAALVIAYLVRFLAVALGPIDSSLGSISRNVDQAGQSLGRSPLYIMRYVHIPILRRSLFTAALVVFVDVMKELPATLILRPFNFNTLAVRSYELANDERLMDASLTSLAIVVAGLIPVILLTKASLKNQTRTVKSS